MKKYRIRVGLDVDDTLYECNSYALSIINKRHPDEEPVKIDDLIGWGAYGRHAQERIALYGDPEFVATQPIIPGAQQFVRDLLKIADVFFVTAVPAQCMSARAERLIKDFPEVPAENIIIGTRKDVIQFDILLDDGSHNISKSRAAYPVLFRKAWNTDLSGLLSVNSYEAFLHFCHMVCRSFAEKPINLKKGGVICLVGPSGSMKNEIANELIKDDQFEKPLTSTTRPKRNDEDGDAYRFITEAEFIKERDDNEYIETTVYSKFSFGIKESDIAPIIEKKHCAVIPIDICGALTLKSKYRNHAALIYLNRSKDAMLHDIIKRDISDDDKVRRIKSIDYEMRNLQMCDLEVNVNDSAREAAEQICEMIGRKLK